MRWPTHPYVWTDEGWRYLAVVLDLLNREIVGWSIKLRMTAELVTDTLTMAWFRRKPGPGLIHHSDHLLFQEPSSVRFSARDSRWYF